MMSRLSDKVSRFSEPLRDGAVRCIICPRKCVIKPGQRGFCNTRENKDGRLISLTYGLLSAIAVDPIEKKPLAHFYPGSLAYSISSVGCSFTCPWCLSPDTEILLNHNMSMKIGELEEDWRRVEVISYDEKDKNLKATPIIKYFKINPKELGLKSYLIRTKETGREIVATEDHPFYTDKGFIRLKDIEIGGKVAVYPLKPLKDIALKNNMTLISNDDFKKFLIEEFPNNDPTPTIKKLEKLHLLPLEMNDPKLLVISRMLGYLFGDGYLTISYGKRRIRFGTVFTGESIDLKEIQRDLEILGFKSSLIIRRRASDVIRYGSHHKIVGLSSWLSNGSKALWCLFRFLGAPTGEKSQKPFGVPNWLFHAPLVVVREFLAGFFGSELTKPRIDRSGRNFYQPRFSMNKSEDLVENGIEFMRDIGRLLKLFDIEITKINTYEGSIRKDGVRTITIYSLISNRLDSLLNLYGIIGYRYSHKREMMARYAYEYLLMKKHMMENWSRKNVESLSLHKSGLVTSEISQIIGVDPSTIRLWLKESNGTTRYGKGLMRFEEWLRHATKDLEETGLVWETVGEKIEVNCDDARDFTTLKNTHCFFAHGFLVSNCQNWHLSQVKPDDFPLRYVPPEDVVRGAKREECTSIAYTYNEPLINLDYVEDVARLARREGVKNVLVTNGYVSEEALERVVDVIDAANVDWKAFSEPFYRKYCSADLKSVLDATVLMRKRGVHVEVTFLIIPEVHDWRKETREMARYLVDNLGPDTPLHLSRFFPHYKFSHLPPTPVESLIKARELAINEGVRYVYVGNVPYLEYENTFCPSCGRAVIEREGYDIVGWHLTEETRCEYCGEGIPVVGRREIHRRPFPF